MICICIPYVVRLLVAAGIMSSSEVVYLHLILHFCSLHIMIIAMIYYALQRFTRGVRIKKTEIWHPDRRRHYCIQGDH